MFQVINISSKPSSNKIMNYISWPYEDLKKEVSIGLGHYDDKRWLILSLINPGHNILELYSVLVLVRFATGKPKLDI